MTPTITDKAILDDIIEQLMDEDNEGNAYANYDDGNTYIDAYVRWTGHETENWITIDGASYLEGIYFEVDGYRDLEVSAWVDDEPANVDLNYITEKLENKY